MPKYTFECPSCGRTEQKYTSRDTSSIPCPDCESISKNERCTQQVYMLRKLPKLSGTPDITEVVDDYTGKTVKQDQSTMIKERHERYYWSVEVPRLVKSGTYGVDTMLELGWIWFDDHGHMQIHDKPPGER